MSVSLWVKYAGQPIGESFGSVSKTMLKFLLIYSGRYDQAGKKLVRIWALSSRHRRAPVDAWRGCCAAAPEGRRNVACAGCEQRAHSNERRADGTGLARYAC